MTTILITTFVVYFACSITIGVWRWRNVTLGEYVAMKNRTGSVFLTCSLLGTTVGGGMFLGIAQLGYTAPISAFAIGVVYCVGGILLGLLSPYLRRLLEEHQVSTLFGLLHKILGNTDNAPNNDRARCGRTTAIPILFSLATLASFVMMLAVQYLSIATFVSFYLKVDHGFAILLSASVFAVFSILVYSATGGFRRDIATDVFQVVVISIGVAILIGGYVQGGVLTQLAGNVPVSALSVHSNDLVILIGAVFLLIPTFLVRFDLWQRMNTAKTDSVSRNSFIAAGLLSLVFFAAFAFAGLFARATGATDAIFAGLHAVERFRGTAAYGIMIVSFFAAVMSSADTFLGVSGLAASRLVPGVSFEHESADSPRTLRIVRVVTLVIGMLALGLAYFIRDIVDLFSSAFGLLSVFLPAVAYALFQRNNASRRPIGVPSILFGLAACVSALIFVPTIAFVAPFVVSALVFAIEWGIDRQRHPSIASAS